jgi:hypothetical protein
MNANQTIIAILSAIEGSEICGYNCLGDGENPIYNIDLSITEGWVVNILEGPSDILRTIQITRDTAINALSDELPRFSSTDEAEEYWDDLQTGEPTYYQEELLWAKWYIITLLAK